MATDTATRGALKDDSKFKSLRDVIKKCNKILETMLVRRERKYTLFFRLVGPDDVKELGSMKKWNGKVEKAVGAVTTADDGDNSEAAGDSDEDSTDGGSGTNSRSSSRAGSRSRASSVSSSRSAQAAVATVGPAVPHTVVSTGVTQTRGRSLMPTAGKVRSRRATPTPRRCSSVAPRSSRCS